MKKALQYIKYNLIMSFKMWQGMLLMFIIIPLVFSYFLAFTNKKIYDIKPEPPEFSVHIKNEDKSQTGQVLDQVFDQLAKEKIIVKEKKASKADFTLMIPEHFGQSLSEGRLAEWTVTLGDGISKEDGQYFQMLLQPISNQLQELPQLEKLTASPEVAQNILVAVNHSLESLTIAEEQVETNLSPTSNQHYALAMISLIMMSVLSSGLIGAVKPELQGYQKRLKLLPMTPTERTFLNWITNTLTFGLWTGLYMLIWKVIDPTTFAGNPLLYALLILLQVGFLLAIAEFVTLFATASTVGIAIGLMSVVWMLFSGILPLDKMGGASGFKIFQENWIERTFTFPFKLISQGEGLGDYFPIGSVISLITLFCLGVAIIILKKREVS